MRLQKTDIWKSTKKDKRKVNYNQSKKDVNGQFRRKMNQSVDGNRKLFWKEVSKVNEGKVENCSRIKDGNGRPVLEEEEVRRIWKEYFEDLCDIDTEEQVAVYICDFD